MENKIREIQQLSEKVPQLKNLQIDNFHEGNFVDAVDETKLWCVGQIVSRNGDKVIVHFEGWSSKFDEEMHIERGNKINHFRRYSKGYSGQKKNAYRDYVYSDNDFFYIKDTIQEITNNEFKGYEPLTITQLVRGKIFTFLDIFMTNSSKESDEYVFRVVDLIYDFLDMAIEFLHFFKENIHLTDLLDKNPDLFLIDEKAAVLACYYEIILTLRRIFGRDERVNYFYKHYNDVIANVPPRFGNNITNEMIPMNQISKGIVFSVSVGNFINYFAEKQGLHLIKDIVLYKNQEKYINWLK